MTTTSADILHVVRNDEGHFSIWPDFRRGRLPAGWVQVGFSGTRDECLKHIVGLPLPKHRLAEKAAQTKSTARATAVPYPCAGAPWRLFVFPHAGSGASYYHFLARALRDDAPEVHIVQYPGREMRVKERSVTRMGDLVTLLQGELAALLAEKPFAFFGHSMGALTAFEFASRLHRDGGPEPRHLFLSGRQAPQIRGPVLNVASLDDDAFLEVVGRRYNALPPELLGNREILDLVLPSLRADFTLMDEYEHHPGQNLDVPFTLLNGDQDPWIDAAGVAGWQAHTTQTLRSRTFPGSHFYLSAAASGLRTEILAGCDSR